MMIGIYLRLVLITDRTLFYNMNLILNIHTSTETAVINLCRDDKVISSIENRDQKQHAAFLHVAIQQLLTENNMVPDQLKAIGVTHGPGSYTGIRVGLATAKGLCFALKIPLITFSTLETLALTAINVTEDKEALYCPMIDARRMEIFTGVYDSALKEVIIPQTMELIENSFSRLDNSRKIYFFGNGSIKFRELVSVLKFEFIDINDISTQALAQMGFRNYNEGIFADLAYSEPLYLKEFYTNMKK